MSFNNQFSQDCRLQLVSWNRYTSALNGPSLIIQQGFSILNACTAGVEFDTHLPSGCEFDPLCCGIVMRFVDRHNHHRGEAELLVDSLTENEDHLIIIDLLYTDSQIHSHLEGMSERICSYSALIISKIRN